MDQTQLSISTSSKTSRPLLYTCRSTRKQGGRSQSIMFMRNCNKAFCFYQQRMHAQNGANAMDKSQRYNQHCWNQSQPLQFTCRSTCKQGLSFQSIWLMWNCNRAVRFVQSARPATKTNQNTLLTQNERTETVGTNQDLFCIHAEVLANKKEGRDPSR